MFRQMPFKVAIFQFLLLLISISLFKWSFELFSQPKEKTSSKQPKSKQNLQQDKKQINIYNENENNNAIWN